MMFKKFNAYFKNDSAMPEKNESKADMANAQKKLMKTVYENNRLVMAAIKRREDYSLPYHPTELAFFTGPIFATMLLGDTSKSNIYLDAINEAEELIQAIKDHEANKDTESPKPTRGDSEASHESISTSPAQKTTTSEKL